MMDTLRDTKGENFQLYESFAKSNEDLQMWIAGHSFL